MTDQTQPTGSQIVTIDAIEQQLATIANVDLEAIGQQIGVIWDDAEKRGDIETVQRVSMIWQNAQQQHAALNTVTNVAATAIGLSKNLTQQRDAALGEYESLAEAVAEGDYHHPLVSGLIEEFEESGLGYAIELSGDNLINAAFQDFCVTQDDTNKISAVSGAFVEMLFCDNLEIYSRELRRKALDFIMDIYPQIITERTAYKAKEAEYWANYKAQKEIERAERIAAAKVYDSTNNTLNHHLGDIDELEDDYEDEYEDESDDDLDA